MTLLSKYNSEGQRMDHTPSGAISAGDVVVVGEIVAHAPEDIAASALGVLIIEGVVEMPKATTSASALLQGDELYWDASAEVVTTTEGSNKRAGYAYAAAAATAATVLVVLARA
jgi:predicted RecA/RadA family phage recombinase